MTDFRNGRSGRVLMALSVLVAAGACSMDATAKGGVFEDEDIPLLSFHEDLRIGSVMDPDVGFSSIGGIDIDVEGLVYVSETQSLTIRVYDAAGERVRTLGGAGEGPGEFLGLTRFGVRGDTIWAWDQRARRVTLFHRRTGALIHTTNLNPVMAPVVDGWSRYLEPSALDSSGVLRSSPGFNSGRPMLLDRTEADGVQPWPTLRYDLNGQVVDSVGWGPESVLYAISMDPYGIATMDGAIELHGYSDVAAPRAEMRIVRLTDALDTVYVSRIHYAPRAVAAGTSESTASTATSDNEGGGDELQAPYGTNHSVGADGALWVERERVAGEFTWMLIGIDGIPIGKIRAERPLQIKWSQDEVFWAVETDEFGVPWVVRYRIETD